MSSSSANSAVVASDRMKERFSREQHAILHVQLSAGLSEHRKNNIRTINEDHNLQALAISNAAKAFFSGGNNVR